MRQPLCVFVSYSHDSQSHKEWVVSLASRLVQNGVDVILDQWSLRLGESVSKFMEDSINRADRVLVVCTDGYVDKVNKSRGGVGYEGQLGAAELMSDLRSAKFIPIVREVTTDRKLPAFLSGRLYVDLSDEHFESGFEVLLREILDEPKTRKPLLGVNPFRATALSGTVAPSMDAERLIDGLNVAHQRAARSDIGFPRETIEALYQDFEAIHHQYLSGFNELYDYLLQPDADLGVAIARVRRSYLFSESQRIKLREFIRANHVAGDAAFRRHLSDTDPKKPVAYPNQFFHGIYLYLTAGYEEGSDQRWYRGLIDQLVALEDGYTPGPMRPDLGRIEEKEFGDKRAAARHLLEELIAQLNDWYAHVTRDFLAIRSDAGRSS